jgi:GT2 family glycosyltransferase
MLTGEGHFRVKYTLPGQPLVSIIIPTRDQADLLKKCIDAILKKTAYSNYEIIVVDNGSKESTTKAYLNELRRTANFLVLNYDEKFNYSKINNFAVKHARGDYILFLNNDTELITPAWLDEMVSHARKSEVGAVGVKLLFPDGTIQHGGVIIGLRGAAGHAFYGRPAKERGYMDLAMVCRNQSAVTAACMLMRRQVFYEVGGFDEELDVALNDVDLCLRVVNKGYYIVWTPFVLLFHHESKTLGQVLSEKNINHFLGKWKKVIETGDLYYNPNLSLSGGGYRIRPQTGAFS